MKQRIAIDIVIEIIYTVAYIIIHSFPIVVSKYNKGSHRSAINPMSTQSNIENSSIIQPPSQQTRWSSETMTSNEKEHYKRALNEIYDAVKLRTQRLDTESGSDSDTHSEGTVLTLHYCLMIVANIIHNGVLFWLIKD